MVVLGLWAIGSGGRGVVIVLESAWVVIALRCWSSRTIWRLATPFSIWRFLVMAAQLPTTFFGRRGHDDLQLRHQVRAKSRSQTLAPCGPARQLPLRPRSLRAGGRPTFLTASAPLRTTLRCSSRGATPSSRSMARKVQTSTWLHRDASMHGASAESRRSVPAASRRMVGHWGIPMMTRSPTFSPAPALCIDACASSAPRWHRAG